MISHLNYRKLSIAFYATRLAKLVLSGVVALGAMSVQANIFKTATTTMNSATLDWATTAGGGTGVAPTITTLGEFGSTPTSGNLSAMQLGGATSLLGLLFDNNTAGPLTVGTTGGFTLTLGASGIDMSAANNNVTLNNPVALSVSQTWNVASGRTLAVVGIVSGSTFGITKFGGGTLDLDGTAVNTYTGGTIINQGTLLEDFSTISPSTTANLINSGSALTLGGGTLQVSGNGSTQVARLLTEPHYLPA